MRHRLAAATVPLVLLFAVSRADEPPPKGVSSAVSVSITNLEVVVTDSKGRRVTDLTKDDFEVKEDGRIQPVTNFALVEEGASAASEPPIVPAPTPVSGAIRSIPTKPPLARIVVFIDSLHLSPGNRNRALKDLGTFLRRTIGPTAEVMIVTWDRALRPRGPFTSDGALVSDVLSRIESESAIGQLRQSERQRLYRQIDEAIVANPTYRDVALEQAADAVRVYSESQIHDVDGTLEAFKVAFGRLAGVEGRRIALFITEKLPQSPGLEIWEYFREALRGSQIPPDLEREITSDPYSRYNRAASYRAVVEAANAEGVTVYTYDAQGLGFDGALSADQGGTGVRADPSFDTMNTETMLRLMADETGGVPLLGRNSLDVALQAVESDWKSYYSVGYEYAGNRPQKLRKVAVNVKRKGLTVRVRRSLLEKSSESAMTDLVLSGLYFPRASNPLKATFSAGRLTKTKTTYFLPLKLTIPTRALGLVPAGASLKGGLLLAVAMRNGDGRISKPVTMRVPVAVPASGDTFVYETSLEIRPGKQTISLAVMDEATRVTSYLQPEFTLGSRAGSSVN